MTSYLIREGLSLLLLCPPLINIVYKKIYFLFLYFVTCSEYLIVFRNAYKQWTVPIIVVSVTLSTVGCLCSVVSSVPPCLCPVRGGTQYR